MPKPAQLLLQHQRLSDRERVLRDNIERIESALASDPEVVQLEEKLEAARAVQQAVATRLHESDRAREDHRSRLRTREKELMSGRIRNPTELMQMSEEVKHMKARFVEEEDAELRLMEDVEIAERRRDCEPSWKLFAPSLLTLSLQKNRSGPRCQRRRGPPTRDSACSRRWPWSPTTSAPLAASR